MEMTCMFESSVADSAVSAAEGSRPYPPVSEIRRIARELRAQGRFMDAAKAYGVAAKCEPEGNAGLFMAYCLRDAGDNVTALRAFEHYAAHHPQDSDGHVALGLFLKQRGEYETALEPLRKALQLREDIATRNTYISCLGRSGHQQEARDEGLRNLRDKHRLALEGAPKSPFVRAGLKPGGRGFDPERPERNIIAFSLWGDRPEYVTGAIVNAQIAKHLYMRWTARFYCDRSVPADAIAALQAFGAQVVMMEGLALAALRPMWRFFVSDDPGVNVFVCRDADSRLNAKELLAVSDWLGSGKRFHVMRDHVLHHELILAGMWGGTAGVLPNIRDYLVGAKGYHDNRFMDQAFLAEQVWPMILDDVTVHDSVFGFPQSGGFPAGYELPGTIHVGGGVKKMPHWAKFIHMPE